MYIALIQNNPTAGALRRNAEQALEALDTLAALAYPPDLVVLPAYALTGAPVDGLGYSDAFAAECLDVAQAFMEKASLPVLAGTLIPRPTEEGGFVCEPEVLFCQGTTHGTLGFVDFENEWNSHSYAASVTTEIDGHTVSVILEGLPEPEDDYSDSDIVVILIAKEYRGTNTMLTSSYQLGYLRAFAQRADSWVVVANLVGAQDDVVFDGASVVIKPDGTVAAAAEPFTDSTLTCNLVLDRALQDAGTDESVHSEDAVIVKPLLPYEADWRALELCIRDYVGKNGFTDVVIGLSGGIDSALTAALAVDALGSEHVHGVLMPGPYSSEGSVSDALALAENLGIETLTLPITKPLKAFTALSQEVLGQEGSFLARQNIQARIRTIHLMHLSNTFGWLLLNTGNKSEAAMGFSTLYGDTAGALAPLGNIYKTDVYGLSHWRNEQHLVIPPAILEKAPSAELYDGQKDQDSLPPYEVLDRILRLHIEEGLGVDQILAAALDDPEGEVLSAELVEQVLDTVRSAEYKRRQEPLAPSLGFADMGTDREWPITNGFKDHHRDLKLDLDIGDYLSMIRSWKQPDGWDFLAN